MANAYVTAEPITLAKVIEAATSEGFTVEVTHRHEDGRPGMISLKSADGKYGCYGMSEEESVHGEIHVGCMRDPRLNDIEMVECGTYEYEDICGSSDDGD